MSSHHPSATHGRSIHDSSRTTSLSLLGRWFYQAILVFLGGVLGTASREALTLALPESTPSLSLLGINVLGALLLGLLLESIQIFGRGRQNWQRRRLVFGTGFLGCFTTYSAFATANAELIDHSRVEMAVLYGISTLILGLVAATIGMILPHLFANKRSKA